MCVCVSAFIAVIHFISSRCHDTHLAIQIITMCLRIWELHLHVQLFPLSSRSLLLTHTRSLSPQPFVPLLRTLCKVQFANNARLSQLVTLQWQAAVAVVVGEFEHSVRHARSHTLPIPLLLTRAPLTHIKPTSHPHANTLSHASLSLCVCVYVCVR